MRFIRIFALNAVLGMGWGQVQSAPTAIPGSFLKKPVRSVRAFVACVRKDPVLQKRYAKHLQMPWSAIPDYFAHNLQNGVIRTTSFYTVYNITREGEIYPTKQRLSQGTHIYRLVDKTLSFSIYGDPIRPFKIPVVLRRLVGVRQPVPPKPVEHVLIIQVPSE